MADRLLADAAGHIGGVSLPSAGRAGSSVADHIPPLPSVGEMACEMLLARTIPNAWLIILGLIRLIPLMTARMIISLKKAADSQRPRLNPEVPGGLSTSTRDHHSLRQMNDIQLFVLEGERPQQSVR